MKEEKLIHKRKNPKGSVLFTVVAVMMVMIVFVMATLTIAGAANKRAYSSYSKNQTTYTARAAVDAVYDALTFNGDPKLAPADQQAFSKAINGISKGSHDSIAISNFDSSMGEIGYYDDAGTWHSGEVYIECLNKTIEQVVLNEDGSINTSATPDEKTKNILRVTATARMAGEDSTVSLYIIKNPNKTSSAFPNALTTKGGFNSGTTPAVFGGSTININQSKWDNKSTGDYILTTASNSGAMEGNIDIVGSYYIGTSVSYILNKNEHMSVMGDFTFGNDSVQFISTYNYADTTKGGGDYDAIPSLFVEGNLTLNYGNTFGTYTNPINIYVGKNFNLGKNDATLYSDIYVYSHDFSADSTDDYDSYDANNLLTSTYLETPVTTTTTTIYMSEYPEWATDKSNILSETYDASTNTTTYICGTYSYNLDSNGNPLPFVPHGSMQQVGNAEVKTETIYWSNPNAVSTFKSNQSSLLQWTSSLIGGGSKIGGNFYTKGCLDVSPQNGPQTFGGDVYVAQDAYISKADIKGSFTCDGKAIFEGENNISGGIWGTNQSTWVFKDNCTINGKQYHNSDDVTAFINSVNSGKSNPGVTFPSDREFDQVLNNGKVIKTQAQIQTNTAGVQQYTSLPDKCDLSKVYDCSTIFYNQDGKEIDISESCVLTGSTHGNNVINIKPGNETLWIVFDNFTLKSSKIVVDDTGSGKVNFFVQEGQTLNMIASNTGILSKTYYDIYTGNASDGTNLSIDSKTSKSPNIYIYGIGNCGIYCENGYVISAYIVGDGIEFDGQDASQTFTNVKYNGTLIDKDNGGVSQVKRVGIIGAAIVGSARTGNDTGIFYIQNGDGIDGTGDETLQVSKDYYQNG